MAYPAYWHNAALAQSWTLLGDGCPDTNAYSVGVPPGDLSIAPIWTSADFNDPGRSHSTLIKDENDTFYYCCVTDRADDSNVLYFDVFNEDLLVDERYEITIPSELAEHLYPYDVPYIVYRQKSETEFDILFSFFGLNDIYFFHYLYVLGDSSMSSVSTNHLTDADRLYYGLKQLALFGGKFTALFTYELGEAYPEYDHAVTYDMDNTSVINTEVFDWDAVRGSYLQAGGSVLGEDPGYAVSTGVTGESLFIVVLYGGAISKSTCDGFETHSLAEIRLRYYVFASTEVFSDDIRIEQTTGYRCGFHAYSTTGVLAVDPSAGAIINISYSKAGSSAICKPFHVPLFPADFDILIKRGALVNTGLNITGYTESSTIDYIYQRGGFLSVVPSVPNLVTTGQMNDTEPLLFHGYERQTNGDEANPLDHYDYNFYLEDGAIYSTIHYGSLTAYCPTGFMGKWPITNKNRTYAIWGSPYIASSMGVFVQTVELDTSGSIPGSPILALGFGQPEQGDRAAWNIFEYPTIHADDIYRDHHHYHSPIPDDIGQSPVWNGTKWVPGYVMTDGGEYGWESHWHLEEDVTDMLHDAVQIQGVQVIDNPTASEYLMYSETSGSYISNPLTSEKSSLGLKQIGITSSGSLGATGSIPTRLLSPWEGTIQKVVLSSDPPGGQSLIADVNKNGTTIFTDQGHRPAIAAGDTTGDTTDIDISSVSVNDIFTIDVDQIGTSGSPGGNLSVFIVVNT